MGIPRLNYFMELGTIVNTNQITFKRNAMYRLELMLVLCKYSIKMIAMTGYDDRLTKYMIKYPNNAVCVSVIAHDNTLLFDSLASY